MCWESDPYFASVHIQSIQFIDLGESKTKTLTDYMVELLPIFLITLNRELPDQI